MLSPYPVGFFYGPYHIVIVHFFVLLCLFNVLFTCLILSPLPCELHESKDFVLFITVTLVPSITVGDSQSLNE